MREEPETFDIANQNTVFTSILDAGTKSDVAREIAHEARAPRPSPRSGERHHIAFAEAIDWWCFTSHPIARAASGAVFVPSGNRRTSTGCPSTMAASRNRSIALLMRPTIPGAWRRVRYGPHDDEPIAIARGPGRRTRPDAEGANR